MNEKPTGRAAGSADARRAGTEAAVLDATERLLATTTISDLSVAQILTEAGISRASFYKYYGSKHDVLLALLRRLFEAVGVAPPSSSDPAAEPDVRSVLRDAMGMWALHGGVISAAVESMHVVPAVGEVWAGMRERLVVALAARIRTERDDPDAPPGLAPELVATMLIHAVERTFYVASNGLDGRLRGAAASIEALDALVAAAVHGAGGPTPARPAR